MSTMTAEARGNASVTGSTPVQMMRRYIESRPRSFTCTEEWRRTKLCKALRAELLCSGLLVVVLGCGGERSCGLAVGEKGTMHRCFDVTFPQQAVPIPHSNDDSNSTPVKYPRVLSRASSCHLHPHPVHESLLQLATVSCLVQCFGNISGAQFSPTLALSLLVLRYISPLRAVAYISVQVLGALLAVTILHGLSPSSPCKASITAFTISEGVTVTQAFGIEFLASFLVVITYLATLDPNRRDAGCKSLMIGLAYAASSLMTVKHTGAAASPARALAHAVMTGVWKHHWVYWLGSFLGGVLASFTYEFTHDSTPEGAVLRRSFRIKPISTEQPTALNRDNSCISTLTTAVSTP